MLCLLTWCDYFLLSSRCNSFHISSRLTYLYRSLPSFKLVEMQEYSLVTLTIGHTNLAPSYRAIVVPRRAVFWKQQCPYIYHAMCIKKTATERRRVSLTLKMKAASSWEASVLPVCHTRSSWRENFKSDSAHKRLLSLFAALIPSGRRPKSSTRTGYPTYIRIANLGEQVKIHGNRFQFQLISAKLSFTTKFICIWMASVGGNYI
jgi:hypothetical protein